MVSFITAMNAMMSRKGTYGVESTPSVVFFFRLVCRKRDFVLVIEPILIVGTKARIENPLLEAQAAFRLVVGNAARRRECGCGE